MDNNDGKVSELKSSLNKVSKRLTGEDAMDGCEKERKLDKNNELEIVPRSYRRKKVEIGEKGSHWSSKALNKMTHRDWRILREDFEIRTRGKDVPPPIRFWSDAALHPEIKKALQECGFKKPTPIQMQGISIGLQQRDLLGIAETGSGKTIAYLLPLIEFCLKQTRLTINNADMGPYALVLVPTRELAQQIFEEAEKLTKFSTINVSCLVGGENIEKQRRRMAEGCEVVIATPGRLLDCLKQRYLSLQGCSYVVLDEADRMCELNFEQDLEIILNQVNSMRSTMLFSATMPSNVESLAKSFLSPNSIHISIGDIGRVVATIKQRVIWVEESEKKEKLLSLCERHRQKYSILIFVNNRSRVQYLTKFLQESSFHAQGLHGGKSQRERTEIFDDFKSKKLTILVATDVAARGLDVDDLDLVIQYDMANNIETYKHRVGRTGRKGKSGEAITLFTPENSPTIGYELKKLLMKSKQEVPHRLATDEGAMMSPTERLRFQTQNS